MCWPTGRELWSGGASLSNWSQVDRPAGLGGGEGICVVASLSGAWLTDLLRWEGQGMCSVRSFDWKERRLAGYFATV